MNSLIEKRKKFFEEFPGADADSVTKAEILTACLQVAVPISILKVLDELRLGISLDELIEAERESNVLIEQEAAFFITGSPERWRGKEGRHAKSPAPGMPALTFARLARHIAVMSFCHPLKFLGAIYDSRSLLENAAGDKELDGNAQRAVGDHRP